MELTDEQKARRASLAWKLLEYKYWYYERNESVIDDYEYDKLEKEFIALGGVPVVGFPNTDSGRPNFSYAAFLVRQKLDGVPYEDLQKFKPPKGKVHVRSVEPEKKEPNQDPWEALRKACS